MNGFIFADIVDPGGFYRRNLDCAFKSTKNLNRYILDSLNKPKVPGVCMFPLANPHDGSIVDIVPYGASALNPLKVFKILSWLR